MKNLLMFFGSCGHTTVEEIDDETWLKFATTSGRGEVPPHRSRTGRTTRMVYVSPRRYTVCTDCMRVAFQAVQREHEVFTKRRLRECFNAPYPISHNFGSSPTALREERLDIVVRLGKTLMPTWTDAEILRYALEPSPDDIQTPAHNS